MLKGSVGKFRDFLSPCKEDIVVMAHAHTSWKENKIRTTRKGDVFYLNIGSDANDVSMGKLGLTFLKMVATKRNNSNAEYL